MDYAFVPGRSRYDNLIKSFYQSRTEVQLVDVNNIVRLDQFIDYLETPTGSVKPVDNIFLSGHGNDGGQFFITFADIDLDDIPGPDSVSTWELLEIADASRVNNLATSLIGPNTQINIKGCKIGQDHAIPFVQKLKSCFGNAVPVTAPKHFHLNYFWSDIGILEYLGYDFSIVRLTAFSQRNARADLITAFQDKNFTFLDGITSIPDSLWNTWLPRNVSTGRRDVSYRVNFLPVLKDDRGRDVTSRRLNVTNGFRADIQSYPYVINYPGGNAPTTRSSQETALRNSLQSNTRFSTSHLYPLWKEFELDSLDEFIDGLEWSFSRIDSGQNLVCTGTRVQYTIVVPITNDPLVANSLLLNISPNESNSSPTSPQILETNTDLFLTV